MVSNCAPSRDEIYSTVGAFTGGNLIFGLMADFLANPKLIFLGSSIFLANSGTTKIEMRKSQRKRVYYYFIL
jgi:hypothetical protein